MRWMSLALALCLPASAAAYVRTTTQSSSVGCPAGEARPLFWYAVTVPYVVDAAGTPDVTGDLALQAVRRSFKTWQDVDGAYISFRDDGDMQNAPVGYVHNGSNLRVVKWLEDAWQHSAQAIAVTLTTFDCATGQILDADIVLNGKNFTFAVESRPFEQSGKADVENTVTHEIGHLLGFDHTSDRESTMYADAPLGETKKRDLTADDLQGLVDVYPLGQEPKLGACAQDASCLVPRGGGCQAAGGRAGGLGTALLLGLLGLVALARRRRHAALGG